MRETHITATEHDTPWRCELRIKGHLNNRWTDWLEGLTIAREDNGETLLRGRWPIRPRCMACEGTCVM
jgi:hypothetical protein